MKRALRKVVIGAVLVLLAMTAAGCGKKADPMATRDKPGLTIEFLEAATVGEGVRLCWSMKESGDSVALFKIFRHDPGKAACPGCPRDYRLLETLGVNEGRLGREGEKGFRYIDREAIAERPYVYQVVGCDRNGRCSAPSPEAQILPGQ